MRCPDCAACSASLTNVGALAPKRGMEKRILEGTVKDLSPKRTKQVGPDDALKKAVEIMRAENVGCVLAVEDEECVGILSDREIVLKVPESRDLAKTPVSEVMTPHPVCLRESDEIAVAFQQMVLANRLHLPVRLKDGAFAVVSARDLLRYLCK